MGRGSWNRCVSTLGGHDHEMGFLDLVSILGAQDHEKGLLDLILWNNGMLSRISKGAVHLLELVTIFLFFFLFFGGKLNKIGDLF